MSDVQIFEDMQRMDKIYKIKASENSHQCWFMYCVSFMLDDIGEPAYFILHKLLGFFTTVCVLCTLYITNIMIHVDLDLLE